MAPVIPAGPSFGQLFVPIVDWLSKARSHEVPSHESASIELAPPMRPLEPSVSAMPPVTVIGPPLPTITKDLMADTASRSAPG